MQLFVFSSQSETQGMVLAEAMATGTPVVALDAPGAREIVSSENGQLLPADTTEEDFAANIAELMENAEELQRCADGARRTASRFSLSRCGDQMLKLYESLVRDWGTGQETDPAPWDRLLGRLEIEWNLLVQKTTALTAAAAETEATRPQLQ
jgi:hypothetical protein